MWKTTALVAALGSEFVGMIVGGLYLGHLADTRLDSAPVGLLLGGALGMLGITAHIARLLRQLRAMEDATTPPADLAPPEGVPAETREDAATDDHP